MFDPFRCLFTTKVLAKRRKSLVGQESVHDQGDLLKFRVVPVNEQRDTFFKFRPRKIALAMPGGGTRAMSGTTGQMRALESMNLMKEAVECRGYVGIGRDLKMMSDDIRWCQMIDDVNWCQTGSRSIVMFRTQQHQHRGNGNPYAGLFIGCMFRYCEPLNTYDIIRLESFRSEMLFKSLRLFLTILFLAVYSNHDCISFLLAIFLF